MEPIENEKLEDCPRLFYPQFPVYSGVLDTYFIIGYLDALLILYIFYTSRLADGTARAKFIGRMIFP
jgi:hypothetical protein